MQQSWIEVALEYLKFESKSEKLIEIAFFAQFKQENRQNLNFGWKVSLKTSEIQSELKNFQLLSDFSLKFQLKSGKLD